MRNLITEARKIQYQERAVLFDSLRVIAKLANRFPQAIQHLREGKTCLTNLALTSDKMTETNERVIWDNILDMGRPKVEGFLRRVQLVSGLRDSQATNRVYCLRAVRP